MQRAFTLVELLLAIAIMLLLAQFLTTIFVRTGEVSTGQVKSMELVEQAQAVLDQLQNDIRRMNLINKDTQNNIGLYGRDYSPASGTLLTPFSLAFVTSNYDLRLDSALTSGEAMSGQYYDGLVNNNSMDHLGSNGMQEVAYYLSRVDQEIPTWRMHRAMRSPPGGADSLLNLTSSEFAQKQFTDHYRIAENIIYTSVSYSCLEEVFPQTSPSSWKVVSQNAYVTSSGNFYPGAIKLTVSFASPLSQAQNEGAVMSANDTTLIIEKTNGVFPKATSASQPHLGYILVGSGLGAGVFEYTRVSKDANEQYAFTGHYVIATPQTSPGTSIILGHTYSRSVHIR